MKYWNENLKIAIAGWLPSSTKLIFNNNMYAVHSAHTKTRCNKLLYFQYFRWRLFARAVIDASYTGNFFHFVLVCARNLGIVDLLMFCFFRHSTDFRLLRLGTYWYALLFTQTPICAPSPIYSSWIWPSPICWCWYCVCRRPLCGTSPKPGSSASRCARVSYTCR